MKRNELSSRAPVDGGCKFLETLAAADHQKNKSRVMAQPLGGGEHSVEFVRPAQISGIAENEFARQTPFLAQRIVLAARTDGFPRRCTSWR